MRDFYFGYSLCTDELKLFKINDFTWGLIYESKQNY